MKRKCFHFFLLRGGSDVLQSWPQLSSTKHILDCIYSTCAFGTIDKAKLLSEPLAIWLHGHTLNSPSHCIPGQNVGHFLVLGKLLVPTSKMKDSFLLLSWYLWRWWRRATDSLCSCFQAWCHNMADINRHQLISFTNLLLCHCYSKHPLYDVQHQTSPRVISQ